MTAEGNVTHLIQCSSGAGSAAAGKLAANRYGAENVRLLFADVNGEHHDNYRFLLEAWRWIGAPLVILDNGGRTIWDVFRKQRFLGNSRIDPCSKYLKREVIRKWMEQNYAPEQVVAHLGFDVSEGDRITKAFSRWAPWAVDAPLTWEPPVWKDQALDMLAADGIEPPWLTRMRFPHANCGGMCVKMGHKQARKALDLVPDRFAEWERNEEAMRRFLGADVSILKDRKNLAPGEKARPFTLRQLREQQTDGTLDLGGDGESSCSCMTTWDPDEVLDPALIDAHAITDPDEVEAYLLARITAESPVTIS